MNIVVNELKMGCRMKRWEVILLMVMMFVMCID